VPANVLQALGGSLDDWGRSASPPDRRAILLEIVEDRYDRGSLIIQSGSVDRWHDLIGVPLWPTQSWIASSTTPIRIGTGSESLRKRRASP